MCKYKVEIYKEKEAENKMNAMARQEAALAAISEIAVAR